MDAKKQRAYDVRQRANKIMRDLRDFEDWVRVYELPVPSNINTELADRIREVHECLTERVLNGKSGQGLSRKQMEDVINYFEMEVLYDRQGVYRGYGSQDAS